MIVVKRLVSFKLKEFFWRAFFVVAALGGDWQFFFFHTKNAFSKKSTYVEVGVEGEWCNFSVLSFRTILKFVLFNLLFGLAQIIV